MYDSLHKTLRGDVLGPGRYFLGVSAVPLVYDTRTRTVEFVSYCGADETPTPDDGAGFTAAADAADQRLRCSARTWGATEPQARSLEMWTADGQWVTLEASCVYRGRARARVRVRVRVRVRARVRVRVRARVRVRVRARARARVSTGPKSTRSGSARIEPAAPTPDTCTC